MSIFNKGARIVEGVIPAEQAAALVGQIEKREWKPWFDRRMQVYGDAGEARSRGADDEFPPWGNEIAAAARPYAEADAEQMRLLLDDRDDVVPAVARVDVLIDRRVTQELVAELMILLVGHDDL